MLQRFKVWGGEEKSAKENEMEWTPPREETQESGSQVKKEGVRAQ